MRPSQGHDVELILKFTGREAWTSSEEGQRPCLVKNVVNETTTLCLWTGSRFLDLWLHIVLGV